MPVFEVGQTVILPSRPSITITVERNKPNGFVELIEENSGGTTVLHQDLISSEIKRGNLAVEQVLRGKELSIDPNYIADPKEPGISLTERKMRVRRVKLFQEARSLHFFAKRHDEMRDVKRTDRALSAFIRSLKDEAKDRGLVWIPSNSSLRRALRKYGKVGDRPFVAFLERHSRSASGRWPQVVLDLGRRTSRYFWSNSRPSRAQALLFFNAILDRYNRFCIARGFTPIDTRPSDPTVVLWIRDFVNRDRYALRYGPRAAKRRFNGRWQAERPDRALQMLMIDDTPIDCHGLLLDDEGKELYRGRPHLTVIMDVYSRMILAAILSFEPPSTFTAMLALREALSPKYHLVERFGAVGGATDGYGLGTTIICDNHKSYNEVSFHTACETVGLNFDAGATGVAEHKNFLERFFQTLNTGLWHTFKEGVRYPTHIRRQLRDRPESNAVRSLEELQALLWTHIIFNCHTRKHPEFSRSIAGVWKASIAENNRRSLDDLTTLDSLGTVRRCVLTPYGVRLDGQRFHDPQITSQLLDSLMRTIALGDPRKSPYKAQSIPILVTIQAADCSAIQVWDPVSKKSVRLPNVNPKLQRQIPWAIINEWIEETTDETEVDNVDVRKKQDSLRRKISPRKRKEALHIRKVLSAKRLTKVALKDGIVIEETAPASVSGMASSEIKVGSPAKLRTDSRIPHKSEARGRSKKRAVASRKAMQPKPIKQIGAPEVSDLRVELRPLVSDPAAVLRELERDLRGGADGQRTL